MSLQPPNNASRNEVKIMVLSGLAEICRNVAAHEAIPEDMREQARNYVRQFDFLLPVKGQGNPDEHSWGETLLVQISQFLPRVVELHSWPAIR